MRGTKSLERAATEARRAAERARDFAALFDQYADCLLQADAEERASELRLKGKSRLAELREAVSDSDDWARVIEWETETRLFDETPKLASQ
jgi:hypothetical protein